MPNQVTLTFAGDSQSLERTFSKVGAGATEMAGDFDKASKEAKSLDTVMGNVGSTVDSSESKFMGTADVLDGLASTFGLNIDAQIGFARAMGDITGGLTSLGPLLSGVATKLGLTSAATWAWNAAQTALNFVLSMNPIGLIVIGIAALVAGFILAWKHSETFRDVVRGAMDKVREGVGWVMDRFTGLWNFIRDLPGKVASAFGGLAEIITAPYRAAFNAIARLWNNTVGKISFEVPSWVPGMGGKGFSMPTIPTFHQGGTMPGNPEQVVPILAMAGETVVPAGGSGGTVINISAGAIVTENQLADLVHKALLRKQQRGGSLGFA
jgi:phage-related protein